MTTAVDNSHPAGTRPAAPSVAAPGGRAAGGAPAAAVPPDGRGSSNAGGSSSLSGVGLLVVLLGVLLPMLDFFIVNVALPSIDRDLHASPPVLELVVSAYSTAYALLLVVGGRLGDSLGRRRLFLAGMAGFTLASLACGLAPTAVTLVIARAAQGAAAAMMVPQVLATIQATTSGQQRVRALSRFGATGGIGAVSGQLLGGLLVAGNLFGTGWRPIFLVNIPVGLIGLVLAYRHVPDTRAGRAANVDWRGTLLLAAVVLALLIPLTEGRTLGWPGWTLALLAAAPVAAAAFVAVERRAERTGHTPLVPPSLLRHASMRRGLGLAIPFFAGFGGFMFTYALAVQRGLHAGPLASGVGLLPMAVAFFAASLSTPPLLARFGTRVLTAGGLLQGVGLAVVIVTIVAGWPHLPLIALAPGLTVMGFGQGLIMSPLFGVVLADVPAASAGVGGGVLTTTQQTALALGVATLGGFFLSLAAAGGGNGIRTGLLVVLCCQAAIAALVAAGSLRLPDTRRR